MVHCYEKGHFRCQRWYSNDFNWMQKVNQVIIIIPLHFATTENCFNKSTQISHSQLELQMHEEYDVALSKYKIAVQTEPASVALWNNIGMCFYSKQKYVAVS